ncbi:unnamed protein product [Rotaria sp. Silwood2]|nr:unnamed protein product [Rotaria sp. Silwood2]
MENSGGAFYSFTDNVIRGVLTEKDPDVITKKILENTVNITFTYAFADYYVRQLQLTPLSATALTNFNTLAADPKYGFTAFTTAQVSNGLISVRDNSVSLATSNEHSYIDPDATELIALIVDMSSEAIRQNKTLKELGVMQVSYSQSYDFMNKYLELQEENPALFVVATYVYNDMVNNLNDFTNMIGLLNYHKNANSYRLNVNTGTSKDFNAPLIGIGTGWTFFNALDLNFTLGAPIPKNGDFVKFVFDCGSNSIRSYLDREIADYKARELNGHLNLLILSHFDADHVNGVFNLLGGIKCDRLVIPYYDPIERLLLAIINNDANDDYISMLQNPIDFFSGDRFNIDEIVIVGGPEENDSDQIINPDRIPPKESNGKINDAKSFKFSADYLSGKEKAKRLKYIANSEGFTANLNKVQFLKIPHLVLIDIWEFIFYVKGCKSDAHEEFKNEINSFQTDYSLTMAEMFSVNNLKRIKSIYSTHFGANLNVTSMGDYILNYVQSPDIKLSEALCCSAAVPFLIGPLKLKTDKYKWFKYANQLSVPYTPIFSTLHIWDGGAYDNLGIEPLLKLKSGIVYRPEFDFLVVSDAAMAINTRARKWYNAMRLIDVTMDQVRALRARSLMDHFKTNANTGVYMKIGDTVDKIHRESGATIILSDLTSELTGNDIVKAKEYPTTLWKMKEQDFNNLFKHGWEVANAVVMEVEINMINVEDGDGIILLLKKNKKKALILIDGGYSSYYTGPNNRTKSRIEELLPEYNNKIDLVIITHYDNDHIGALDHFFEEHGSKVSEDGAVLKAEYKATKEILGLGNLDQNEAGLVLESMRKFRSIEEKLLLLKKDGLVLKEPQPGEHLANFPEFRVIAPGIDYYNTLLPKLSDAGIETLKSASWPWENLNDDWRKVLANVFWLDLPHHGSKSNISEDLIKLIAPKICFISADNVAHPDQDMNNFVIEPHPLAKLTSEQYNTFISAIKVFKDFEQKTGYKKNYCGKGAVIEVEVINIIQPSQIVTTFSNKFTGRLSLMDLSWCFPEAQQKFSSISVGDKIECIVWDINIESEQVKLSQKHILRQTSDSIPWVRIDRGDEMVGTIIEDIGSSYLIKTHQNFYGLLNKNYSDDIVNGAVKVRVQSKLDENELLLFVPSSFDFAFQNEDTKEIKIDHIESLLVQPDKIKTPIISKVKLVNKDLIRTEEKTPDNNQLVAIRKAIGNQNIFLIQGPPGTGKTTVIAEIIEQLVASGEKILVAGQNHVAVDNVLSKMTKVPKLNLLRVGKEDKIDKELQRFHIDKLIADYQMTFNLFLLNQLSLIKHFYDYKIKGVKPEILLKSFNKRVNEYAEKYEVLSEILKEKHFILRDGLDELTSLEIEETIISFDAWIKSINNETELLLKPMIYGSVDVVFATCIGIKTDSVFKDSGFRFDTVIIDEAGKANIAETLVAIELGKKVILVGDQMQLPPYMDSSLIDPADPKSFPRSEYGFGFTQEEILHALKTSFFEFLIRRSEIDEFPKENIIMLNYQYRMHPNIGEFVSEAFYGGKVLMGELTHLNKLDYPSPFDKEIIFFDTSNAPHPYEQTDGYSARNDIEAEAISESILPKFFENEIFAKNLAIIAPYKSQVANIQKCIRNSTACKYKNIDVSTLDSFQGKEYDVIIFSFTRSSDHSKPEILNGRKKYTKVGFLDDARRLNVAFSRAKKKLILIGNSKTLKDPKSHFDLLFNYTGLFNNLIRLKTQ